MMQYSKNGVKWKTAYEVCEMKKRLEKESDARIRMTNKEAGLFVKVYAQTEEGVFCKTGSRRMDLLNLFDVRTVQWEGKDGLEKAFIDAGYGVYYVAPLRRKSL